jgi:DNA polymerase-3 subunit epsilon
MRHMAFHWIGKSVDGSTVTLQRLDPSHFRFPDYFNADWEAAHSDLVRLGAVIDVETTGLSHSVDQVIEIGLRQFKFNRATGEILAIGPSYTAFQDPGQPLSALVTRITGITDEMVKGQQINWGAVDELLASSSIVIAHNAAFDRPFLDRLTTTSSKKIWGCSFQQVDWDAKGYPSQKLEVLAIYHGFFNDAHRAQSDVDSLVYLLSLRDPTQDSPYLKEILSQAKKTTIHLVASNSPFESKDLLKARDYRWDAQNKSWSKQIDKDALTEELSWLEDSVYHGAFRGRFHEIQPVDRFKS